MKVQFCLQDRFSNTLLLIQEVSKRDVLLGKLPQTLWVEDVNFRRKNIFPNNGEDTAVVLYTQTGQKFDFVGVRERQYTDPKLWLKDYQFFCDYGIMKNKKTPEST